MYSNKLKAYFIVFVQLFLCLHVFSNVSEIRTWIDYQVDIDKYPLRYSPLKLIDSDLKTAFAYNGAKSENKNLREAHFNIDVNDLKIDKIRIYNGYQKSKDLFLKNSRIKKLQVKFSKKVYGKQYMPDGYSFQSVKILSTQVRNEMGYFDIKLPKISEYDLIHFNISEVYTGKKYKDVCISEIEFYYKGKKVPIKNLPEIRSNYLKELHEYYKKKVIRAESKPFKKSWWFFRNPSDGSLGLLSFLKNGSLLVYNTKFSFKDYDIGNVDIHEAKKSLKSIRKYKWYCKNQWIYFVISGKHYRINYRTMDAGYNPENSKWSFPRGTALIVKNTPLKGKYINEFNPM